MYRTLCLTIQKLLLITLLPISLWGSGSAVSLTELQNQLEQTNKHEERVDLLVKLSRKTVLRDEELAVKYINEALDLALSNDYKAGEAEVLRTLGIFHANKGEHPKGLDYYQSSLQIAQEEALKELEAKLYIHIGYSWYQKGDSAKALGNYERSLEVSKQSGDKVGVAKANMKLGWGYDYFGNFEKAKYHFSNAAEQSQLTTDTILIIDALFGLAAFHINKSIEANQSLEQLLKALEFAKQRRVTSRIAKIYKGIGVLYTNLGQQDLAKEFYINGLELLKELNPDSEFCWLYRAIGEICNEQGEYDEAFMYFEKALKIVEQTANSSYHKGLLFKAIGNIYQNRDKDYDKAIHYFKEALAIAEKRGDLHLLTTCKMRIGLAYVHKGQFEEGKQWCHNAQESSQKYMQVAQPTCECLYLAHKGLNDFKGALTYLEKLRSLTDTLHQQELSEELNSLAAQKDYEQELTTLQKDQEIKEAKTKTVYTIIIGAIIFMSLLIIMGLSISNIKKTTQKNQIKVTANLRKELMANISHDLRTPITVMQGYIETMQMKINTVSNLDKERYLNVLLSNAKKLSLMISQLFEYSKLETEQVKPNKESFPIKELAKDIVSDYEIIAEKQRVKVDLDCTAEIPNVFADIVLIERVIQNLINNALKYTPEDGTITICLMDKDGQVEVEITDTGKGISEADQKVIFDRYHKGKSSNGAGLGLTIVKKILELHESTIRVTSQLNQGTTFIFTLPSYTSSKASYV